MVQELVSVTPADDTKMKSTNQWSLLELILLIVGRVNVYKWIFFPSQLCTPTKRIVEPLNCSAFC